MRLTKDVAEWFDHRLQLGTPIKETMEHRVPRNTASWAYVFGSASLTVNSRGKTGERGRQAPRERTGKHVSIPLGDSLVPVSGDHERPQGIGYVRLSRNEVMRLRNAVMSGASDSEIEFHVEFSNWRRRHQAIARWHHHARRLRSAALASREAAPEGQPRKVTRRPGTASTGRPTKGNRKRGSDHPTT